MLATTLVRGAAALGAAVGAVLFFGGRSGSSAVTAVPAAVVDESTHAGAAYETAVFSGGCFWGVQAVFEHVKGVESAVSGYAGGQASTASYEQVSTGTTGHAESVRVIFDPSRVSYGKLLEIFFAVAHDPTQKNRQGPDVGTQYRSVIWYTTPEQKRVAEAYIAQLASAHVYSRPIVTQVAPLSGFWEAEGYHQDYATKHPDDMYIAINDRPKVENLHARYPQLWRDGITP
jgi:peptide-methionine (S)-S-oxide reductase